jgi:hypothetical protein
MAIKLSQGLLSSLGGAGGAQQPSGQPMGSGLLQPAMSSNPLVNTLVRSVGQARGMDMRTPQEKVQAELKKVEDPTSVEGLRQQAEIFANLGTAKGIELALNLTNRAADLGKLKKQAEALRQKKIATGSTLTRLGLTEQAKSFADGGITIEDAQGIINKERDRLALVASENLSDKKARRTKASIATKLGAPADFVVQVNNGAYDDYDAVAFQNFLEDSLGLSTGEGKTADTSFTSQNWVATIKDSPEQEIGLEFDSKSGKYRVSDITGDDKLYTQAQLKKQFDIDLIRKSAAAGASRSSPFDKPKQLTQQAQTIGLNIAGGSLLRVADLLSEAQEEGGTLQVAFELLAADSDLLKVGAAGYDKEIATRASNLDAARKRVVEGIQRVLSGAAIKGDEYDRALKILTPALSDFATPKAMVEKLITSYAMIQEIHNLGLTGKQAVDFMENRAVSIAADPITNEVNKAIEEGNYRLAIELRTGTVSTAYDDQVDAIAKNRNIGAN